MGVLTKNIDWRAVVRAVLNEALIKEGNYITGLTLKQNEWHYMDINDDHSVKMMQISKEGEKQKIIVHYPENSSIYKDPHRDKYKIAEVWKGEIYDEVTGKKYVKGDIIEAGPIDRFKPKTFDKECYVVVEISDKKPKLDFFNRNC